MRSALPGTPMSSEEQQAAEDKEAEQVFLAQANETEEHDPSMKWFELEQEQETKRNPVDFDKIPAFNVRCIC